MTDQLPGKPFDLEAAKRCRHKWETHSVTEINGAGVHLEYWEQCIKCGDYRDQYTAPAHEITE